MLSSTGSGTGKTTITMAVLALLKKRGLKVAAFKSGPDFIDPMFHEKALGVDSANLDMHMLSENALLSLMAKNSQGCDIAVIEGAMGYYDGVGVTPQASASALSCLTKAPTALIVGSHGMGASMLALISGFLNYGENTIAGAIFNYISENYYSRISQAAESQLGISAFGYMPRMQGIHLQSRQLGLITADEIENINEIIGALCAQAEKSIDIDAILAAAAKAPVVEFERIEPKKAVGSVCVAVALDEAFCFYYKDSLRLLEEMGAEIIYFSPLHGERLPEPADCLILGGGYPELYLKELSENRNCLASIRSAIEHGMPVYAESGGFMYLHDYIKTESGEIYPLVGAVSGSCENKGRLVRFGYCELEAMYESCLSEQGGIIKAHEFHYYDSTNLGDAFEVRKAGESWRAGFAYKNLIGQFPHINFCSNPLFAERFLIKAMEYNKSNKSKG